VTDDQPEQMMARKTGSRRVGFTWVDHNVLFLPKKRKPMYYAICEHSKRIAKATMNMLTILVVNDTYINETKGQCEEGQRCLDFDCPLNHGTLATYAHGTGVRRITKQIREIGRKRAAFNQTQDGELADYTGLVREPGTIVTPADAHHPRSARASS
jgi:hypothetical protein